MNISDVIQWPFRDNVYGYNFFDPIQTYNQRSQSATKLSYHLLVDAMI
jgi:hypothetical protein